VDLGFRPLGDGEWRVGYRSGFWGRGMMNEGWEMGEYLCGLRIRRQGSGINMGSMGFDRLLNFYCG